MTEDIVSVLDSKLKDAGFSEGALRIAKEELKHSFAKLKIFLDGRKNILSDFAARKLSSEEAGKTASEAMIAFEEAGRQMEELETSLKKYQDASPAFITEFLSPEGIMTKKRGIDEKINQNRKKVVDINNQIKDLHSKNSELTQKINEYKETLQKLKLNEIQMQEQITASQNQINTLNRQLTSEQAQLR